MSNPPLQVGLCGRNCRCTDRPLPPGTQRLGAGSGLRALLRAVCFRFLVRHEVDARELVNRVGQFVRTAPVSA